MTAEFIVAVHAMVYLNHKGDSRQSEEIAQNVCTNPARIRKVMSKLKKAGLIETYASFTGGYRFILDPREVTLYDIFKATDEHIINLNWRSGSNCSQCPISGKITPIINNVFNTIEDAGQNTLKQTTIADIEAQIFQK